MDSAANKIRAEHSGIDMVIELDNIPVSEISRALKDNFPRARLVSRDSFRLQARYYDWLLRGRKCTTIRVKRGAIEYPAKRLLDLTSVDELNSEQGNDVGTVYVDRMIVKPFSCLSESDARRDGFISLADLQAALVEIYGRSALEGYVTIYSIRVCS